MLQILGLRERLNSRTGKSKLVEVFFEKNWRVLNHAELFGRLEEVLRTIPDEEKFNLFYTLHHVHEKKGRHFEKCTTLAFDIDKIVGYTPDHALAVARVVCEALALPHDAPTVVNSGNGVHLIFQLDASLHFTDIEDFGRLKAHYKGACDRINLAFALSAFPTAKADPVIWDAARILRLPGTDNIKRSKEFSKEFIEKPCTLVQLGLKPIKVFLPELSGIERLEPEDTLSVQGLKAYPPPDTDAVLKGCGFLKYASENQAGVSEPEWYAALSIWGRVAKDSARSMEIAHANSSLHPGYNPAETDLKIEQALAHGPRTCQSIHDTWQNSKCRECPHWGKIASPILIHGEDFIRTQETGFHFVGPDPKNPGKIKIGRPDFEGLRRFFERETRYFVTSDTEEVYVWDKTHWELFRDAELKAYAAKHFFPTANNNMAHEFLGSVKRNNLRSRSWFEESTFQKMNFQNGVLDVATGEFTPTHSKDFGFTRTLAYSYDPTAIAPRFEQFMQEVMLGRQELVDITLEFAGYSLSNDRCWDESAVVLLGGGSNGKSTLIKVLKLLAGEGSYSAMNMADLENPANRYHLDGAAFNISEETPNKSLVDGSLFKNLTSGGEVVVKKLFVQPYMIHNRAKLWILCNSMPKTYDMSHGMFRRLNIIPFDATFEGAKKDKDIELKLALELPGILNMAIAAYARMKAQRGLTKSAIVAQKVHDYRIESDECTRWWEENVVVLNSPEEGDFDHYKCEIQTVYSAFQDAMMAEGMKNIPHLVQFCTKIYASYPKVKDRLIRREHKKGKKIRFWLGVTLHMETKDNF